MQVYFIRHGDYIEDVQDGKYQDFGLSAEGIRQTELLRDRLMKTGEIKAGALIASPMRRAHESAMILAPALGLPVTLDKGIEEWLCDDGTPTPAEFSARWQQVSDEQKPFFRFMAGYETGLEFTGRVQAALNRLLQEYDGKTLALVSHGGVIAASFNYFFGLSGATPARVAIGAKNTSLTCWSKAEQAQRWSLDYFNDVHHLESFISPIEE